MSEDRMRALFRQADTSLGHNPPSLEGTVRQARREQTLRRVAMAGASTVVIVVLGVAAYGVLRPERTELTPAVPGPATPAPTLDSCGGPYAEEPGSLDSNDAKRFVGVFMQRRIAQAGAESCLTDGAKAEYESRALDPDDPKAFEWDAGSLCLYRCGPFRVVDYRLDFEPQQADANSFFLEIIVLLGDGKETTRIVEAVNFGPGLQWGSHNNMGLLIRDVSGANVTAGG